MNIKNAISTGQSSGESDVTLNVALIPGDHFTLHGTARPNIITGGIFNEWIYGHAGDDQLNGGGGKDRLFGGTGDDTLAGGSGKDEFVFAAGDGNDTILDFQDGSDRINLMDVSGINSFADLTSKLVQSGDDIVIDLGNGNSITIEGISKAELSAGDFIF